MVWFACETKVVMNKEGQLRCSGNSGMMMMLMEMVMVMILVMMILVMMVLVMMKMVMMM